MRSINLFQFTSDTLPYAFCEQIGKEIRDISDEIPFEIPESWKWCRLDTLFYHNTGKALNSSKTQGEKMQYITTSNLYWNRFELDKLKEMPFTESEIKKCTVAKGDLLVCEGGDVGRAAIWNYDYPMRIQNHIHRVRPYLQIDIYFYYYVFYLYKNIGLIGGKGIGIQGLSTNALGSLFLPLPPLAEQHRIVAKIEELLPFIEKYEQAETKLTALNKSFPEMLKKSILQEAVQGKLVPQNPDDEPASILLERIRTEKQELIKQGKIKKSKHESIIVTRDKIPYEIIDGKERCIADEVPFEIPESWCWCRLGTIASVLGGKRIPAGRKLSLEKTEHVYIRVSDMKDDTVSLDNLQYVPNDIYSSISRYIINKEDVYITVAGTIGRIGKIPKELDGANLTENADRLVIRIINQDWLIRFLKSNLIQNQIAEATTKVGQPKLAILRIQKLLIPLPPLAEQKRIVKKIEELMPIINSISK